MNNIEAKRYMIDPESMKVCLVFTPNDLNEDSHLLPSKISIPLEFGVEVMVVDSNKVEYIFPKSFNDREIKALNKQIKEKLEKHDQFLSSLEPY